MIAVPPQAYRGVRSFLWICTVLLSVLLAIQTGAMLVSWPLVHDAPLIHYIVFLKSHGFAPYRDIVDMNMPGAYMAESLAMRFFGTGALGWVLWDLFLSAWVVFLSTRFAGREKRTYGFMAGAVSVLLHWSDGPSNLGQRDWVVATLLLSALACLLEYVTRGRNVWIPVVTLLIVSAATIKPPALLYLLLPLFVLFRRLQKRQPCATYLLWGIVGAILPVFAVGVHLFRIHAAGAFLATLSSLVPYYASIGNVGWQIMLPSHLGGIFCAFLLSSLLLLSRTNWKNPRVELAAFATVCGIATFAIQNKGWAYHRYPFLVTLSLLLLLLIADGLRTRGIRFWFAGVMLCAVAIVVPARALWHQWKTPYPLTTLSCLENDIRNIGPERLQNSVQCLDMTHGECINVLYRLRLVQTTGSIYDYYLFPKMATPLTTTLQEQFLQQVTAHPPRLFILSEQDWPAGELGYAQLHRWRQFESFLIAHYRLRSEHLRGPSDMAGYRLYERFD